MDIPQRRERRIQNMSRTSRLFELINVLRARRTPVTALYLARELGTRGGAYTETLKRSVRSGRLSMERQVLAFV